MVQSPTMQEVRVESLERSETLEGRMRITAHAGSPSIIFPREVWKSLLVNAPTSAAPTPEELEELAHPGYYYAPVVEAGPAAGIGAGLAGDDILSGRLGWRDVHTTVTGR